MKVAIIPGIHPPQITHSFIQSFNPLLNQAWVVPGDDVPVYSPQHVFTFLNQHYFQANGVLSDNGNTPQSLVFIGFSAGVVGSIGTARQCRSLGITVGARLAFDGWGVPLDGDFPIYRVSHDRWTHWSSCGFGRCDDGFYANPSVEHLDLWRSPHTTVGIRTSGIRDSGDQYHSQQSGSGLTPSGQPRSQPARSQQPETAATFVRSLLQRYDKP